MAEIDLKILPLFRQMGRNKEFLPGIHAVEPSRRASRSRRMDQLILLLSFGCHLNFRMRHREFTLRSRLYVARKRPEHYG